MTESAIDENVDRMCKKIEIDDEEVEEYKTWNVNQTRRLIHYYKLYHEDVGKTHIKTQKKLWELISLKIHQETKVYFNPNKCENRWRVLSRNYKKHIDSNKKGSKYIGFDYSKEFANIFGKNNTCVSSTNAMKRRVNQNASDNKEDVLEKMRQDRLKYYEKKLQLQKEHYHNKILIAKEKLLIMKERNKLLKEHAEILTSAGDKSSAVAYLFD